MDSQTEELLRNVILSDAGSMISDLKFDDNLSLSDIIKEAYNEAVDLYNEKHPSSRIDINLGDEKVEDISQFEELLKNNPELIELIHNLLKNKPIGYLNIIENRLIKLETEFKSSKLVRKDERLLYEKIPNRFYEIFEGANISIDELYIEPPYQRVISDDYNVETRSGDTDLITHCENLLESQQILYLYGPYGYGKTFLTKKILSSISKKEMGFTLYINSRRLPVSPDAFIEVFSYDAIDFLIKKYGRLYIFIDSFEDILFALEKGHSTLNYYEEFMDLCERYSSLYFVINERIPDGITPEYAFLPFSYVKSVKEIIKLENFSNPNISKWIDNYTFYNQNISLSYEMIKDANKNLRSSLKNPLLLLMMAISDNPISSTQSWYHLFHTFIEKTIKGKSELERYRNFFLDSEGKDIYEAFKAFIYDVAYKILKTSKPEFDIEDFQFQDYYLDPNNTPFSIENGKIQSIIEKRFKDFVPEKKKNQLYKYLNCYFFECNRINKDLQYWKFKDNNILFFLFASGFCSLFEAALKKYSSPDNNNSLLKIASPLKEHFDQVPLHPVIIEFILDRIEHTGCSEDYVGFIQDLIRNEEIINIPTKESLSINFEKIKTDILFSIIYIHFNKTYTIENRHCFKRLAQYFSFIKHIDKNIASIIQRYYRNISVIDAEFRGINLKGYNLSYSKLKQVSFMRCKMERTLFKGNYLNDVLFNLCYLNDMTFDKVIGKFTFKSCELLHISVVIDNTVYNDLNPKKELELHNCIVDQVFISSKLNRISIKLRNCEIRQLQINCRDVDLSIEGCVISKRIALKSTNLHYSEDIKNNIINGYFVDSILDLLNIDQGSDLFEKIKKKREDLYIKKYVRALEKPEDNDHGKKSLHQDDITSFKADIKKYVDELCQLQHEFEAKVDRKSLIYAHEIECLKVPLFYFWIKSGFGDFIDLSSDDVDRTTYNMFIKNPISFLRSRVNFLDDNNITFINASLKDELSRLFNNEIKNREKNSF